MKRKAAEVAMKKGEGSKKEPALRQAEIKAAAAKKNAKLVLRKKESENAAKKAAKAKAMAERNKKKIARNKLAAKKAKKAARKTQKRLRKAAKKEVKAKAKLAQRYTNGKFGHHGGKKKYLKCITKCKGGKSYGGYGFCYVKPPDSARRGRKAWGGCLPPGIKPPSKLRHADSKKKKKAKRQKHKKKHKVRKHVRRKSMMARFRARAKALKVRAKARWLRIRKRAAQRKARKKKRAKKRKKSKDKIIHGFHVAMIALQNERIVSQRHARLRWQARRKVRRLKWKQRLVRWNSDACTNALNVGADAISWANIPLPPPQVAAGRKMAVADAARCVAHAKECKTAKTHAVALKRCGTIVAVFNAAHPLPKPPPKPPAKPPAKKKAT